MTRPGEKVKIDLGGGEWTLRYPLASMKEAREEFGGSIASLDTLAKIDETQLARLLWYGLRSDQPEVTVEDIERLVDPTMFSYIMDRYQAAVSASVPEPKKAEGLAVLEELKAILIRAEAILTEAKSTGSNSGVSAGTISDSPTPISGDSPSESSQQLQSVTKAA